MRYDYEGNEITQEYAEKVLLAHLDKSAQARKASRDMDNFHGIPKEIRRYLIKDMQEFNFSQLVKNYGAVMLAAACDAGYRTPADDTIEFHDLDSYIAWRDENIPFHD
jgi:hypothetical protein